jgi:hypothetical protein
MRTEGCLVCRSRRRLVTIVIDERRMHLCLAHAAVALAGGPRALASLAELSSLAGPERRRAGDRRRRDRRFFPRPETRRYNDGRRSTDPS